MRWLLQCKLIIFLPLSAGGIRNVEDFYSSARVGDIDSMVAMLSSGIITSVHQRDSKGNTAFVIAAGRGQTPVLQFLLSKGANIEDTTKGGLLAGKTALSWACSQGRPQAVKFLIDSGADVNHPTEDGVFMGKTPLMWASSQGRTAVVDMLISSGAEIDFAMQGGNFRGKTSLMWASSQGRIDAVMKLLEAGARVNMLDDDGVSALMWATGSEGTNDESSNKGLFEKALKGHNEVVSALLLYGACVDAVDKDNITALMYASFHGHSDAVLTLINDGADVSVKNNAGKTAILLAQSSGHMHVVSVLKKGPTINELLVKDLLLNSVCGWVLSILRRTEGTQFAHIRPSQFTIENTCNSLSNSGLDGRMKTIFDILQVVSIDEVIDQLNIRIFSARVLAKRELIQLNDKVKIHLLREQQLNQERLRCDSSIEECNLP